jgi:ribosome-binding protein aMBF1 (putative translation factor)
MKVSFWIIPEAELSALSVCVQNQHKLALIVRHTEGRAMAFMLDRKVGASPPRMSSPRAMNDELIAPEQVATARRLLGWSAWRLGAQVGASAKTILAFEAGERWSPPLYLDLVRKRLEIEGVEFIENRGVRLRKG